MKSNFETRRKENRKMQTFFFSVQYFFFVFCEESDSFRMEKAYYGAIESNDTHSNRRQQGRFYCFILFVDQ